MIYNSTIWLNDKRVDLTSADDLSTFDNYEQGILLFIKEWLSGSNRFTLHTSGSTGIPKEIEVTRNQMIASAKATVNFLKIAQKTPVTVCIDARYIGGKMQLVRALIHDLPLQIITPTTRLMDQLDALPSLGLMSLVPLQLYNLLDAAPQILNKASAVLIGGAPVQANYLTKLTSTAPPVYHTYGMTETISHVALKHLNGEDLSDEFTSLPGIELATDDRGCLVITGEVTGNQPVTTNDIVELTSPSTFLWKGRYDNVVNSGGVKIFPEEVDKLIASELDAVVPGAQFFTSGVPDEKLGQRLVLCIESAQNIEVSGLIETLKAKLPAYHAPKHIYILEHFIKTSSGKVDKLKTVDSVLS
ncbi:AMP-binding protein [Imperialibacter roseus]|uniref:AMP-binding protein n=1 Tax=Imperialibacter roseus TaxID=1324217 RepID=A0ABZ0IWC3_9BACT|nr:AMP-binding protein [Imperialibacter roseus]WOK08678.1 AMP-binding protein [Imperialibacter roseus]